MNKILRKAKGITLIALVVTVIVLLILAAVSVNLISGSDGILNRAQQATDLTIRAQEREQIVLVYDTVYIDHYEIGGVPFKAFAMEFDRKYSHIAQPVEGVNEIPAPGDDEAGEEVSLFEKIENLLIPTSYATEGSRADMDYEGNEYYNTKFNFAKITYNTGHIYYVALRYASGSNPGDIIDPDPDLDPPEDEEISPIRFSLMPWQEYDASNKSCTINANVINRGSYRAMAENILSSIDNDSSLSEEQKEVQKQIIYIESYNSRHSTSYSTSDFTAFVYDTTGHNNITTLDELREIENSNPYYYNNYSDVNDMLIQLRCVMYSGEFTITCEPQTVNNISFLPESVQLNDSEYNDYNTSEEYLADFTTNTTDVYILKLYEKDDYTANGNNATLLDSTELNVVIFPTEDPEDPEDPNIPTLTGEDEYFRYEYVGPYSGECYSHDSEYSNYASPYCGLLTHNTYYDLQYSGIVGYSIVGFSDAGKTYFGSQTNANVQIPSVKTIDGITLPVVAIADNAFDDLNEDFNIGYESVPGSDDSESYYRPTEGYNFTFGDNSTFNNRNISKFLIPGSVKYLGSKSLGCVNNNYVGVEISEGLQYLGEYAFGEGTRDYENNFDQIGTILIVLPDSLIKAGRLNSEYVNDVFSISTKNLGEWNDGGWNGSTHNLYSMNQSVIIYRGSLNELNAHKYLFEPENYYGYDVRSFAYGSCIYCTKDHKCAVLDLEEMFSGMWFEPNSMEDYIQDAMDKAEENSYVCPASASDTYTLLLNRLEECGYTQVLN